MANTERGRDEIGGVGHSIDGAVATITISNPDRRNAMSLAMYAAIPAAVAAVDQTPEVRVTVVRGAGTEAFGAGSSIDEFARLRMGAAAVEYNRIEHEATEALAGLTMPVVAAIHGPCMGGGVGLALTADLRIAADDAQFAVPPGRLGVGYPVDAAQRLQAIVGPTAAADLLLTARVIDANEAHRIGLVTAVVAKAELDQHVADLVLRISRLAPLTLKAVKLALRHSPEAAEAAASCYDSADYAEGIAAFAAKRRPTFTGR
ncbi:MAG: enoyl-CoA hydratase [Acidimicrobiales bacterium]|nr:enoyl-CoA hydratase [Acidimicrobiales bacterium]